MILPVTLASAGAAGLLNLWLCVRVGMIRRASKISVGDGGDDALIRRMRAQANFVENTPFVLALVAAIELARGPSAILAAVAAIYMLARVAHGVGMDGGIYGSGRSVGTGITMLTLLGLAVWAISIALDA